MVAKHIKGNGKPLSLKDYMARRLHQEFDFDNFEAVETIIYHTRLTSFANDPEEMITNICGKGCLPYYHYDPHDHDARYYMPYVQKWKMNIMFSISWDLDLYDHYYQRGEDIPAYPLNMPYPLHLLYRRFRTTDCWSDFIECYGLVEYFNKDALHNGYFDHGYYYQLRAIPD